MKRRNKVEVNPNQWDAYRKKKSIVRVANMSSWEALDIVESKWLVEDAEESINSCAMTAWKNDLIYIET